jgi:hypothetical protein
MRRFGLALAVLAAIPAIAVPLLACVAAISAPAALIAGIAAISVPAQDGRGDRAPAVSKAAEGLRTNVGDFAQR